MMEKCELCDMEIQGNKYVTHNGHTVCYECVDSMVEQMNAQESEEES